MRFHKLMALFFFAFLVSTIIKLKTKKSNKYFLN